MKQYSKYGQYGLIIRNHRISRKNKFAKMEGYLFGEVLRFNIAKGVGAAIDSNGIKYILHYKDMDRIGFKIVTKGQQIHFRPGVYKGSLKAEDVAIVY